ncbi:MAG: S-adenosylmethionine:tRNA ribosyltransferase-isomerase [Polyangiaceae bacterium]
MDIEVGGAPATHDKPATPPMLVRLLGRSDDGLLEVALVAPPGATVSDVVNAHGHVPLPPYIKRDDDADDRSRYQTVFARTPGAVAAPTAGLHMTHALWAGSCHEEHRARQRDLHVGLGTFQPVTVDDLVKHPMHAEEYEVSAVTADAVARARARRSGDRDGHHGGARSRAPPIANAPVSCARSAGIRGS